MNTSVKEDKSGSGSVKLTVAGDMTIYTVTELKPTLIKGLGSAGNELALDLSKVTRIDTAGYQLLVLLSREAIAGKKKFIITQSSSEVERLFNLYKHNFQ